MTTAFVLGNGKSRLSVPLEKLRPLGPIYGCNAIYRDFMPTVLVSTDLPISTRIQEESIPTHVKHYTRKPQPHSGSLRIPQELYGYSSGPVAVGIASLDKNHEIYLIGLDLGTGPDNKFNNVYADTEFYKKSTARPTYSGNWVNQICTVARKHSSTHYIRVMGETSAEIPAFGSISNITSISMEQFLHRINS